jgi:large subunit ribosomal protein L21
MTYAIVKTGGKQYKVAPGETVTVERLPGEAGAAVTLGEVLLVGGEAGVTVGSPTVAGASVAAEIVKQARGDKVIIFKKNRRQHYRRRNGHRQDLTVLKVTEINA